MSVLAQPFSISTEDKRLAKVDAVMRRHGYDSHALIETLHAVQQEFGCLLLAPMQYVAKALKLPLSKVYGVATFYHFFRLVPHGRHKCVVCLGTTCYIKGGGQVLDHVSERLGIGEGEETADGEYSLISARCIGACGMAPLAVIDGELIGKEKPEQLIEKIERKLEL